MSGTVFLMPFLEGVAVFDVFERLSADKDPTDDVVGLSLRRLRQERHLRLVDVATAAQVSTSFLSDVECGKRQLLLIRLPALARALGVHPLDLLVFPTFPPWCQCQEHERGTA